MKLYRLSDESRIVISNVLAYYAKTMKAVIAPRVAEKIQQAERDIAQPYTELELKEGEPISVNAVDQSTYQQFRTVLLSEMDRATSQETKAVIQNIIDNFRQLFN